MIVQRVRKNGVRVELHVRKERFVACLQIGSQRFHSIGRSRVKVCDAAWNLSEHY